MKAICDICLKLKNIKEVNLIEAGYKTFVICYNCSDDK